MQFTEFCCVSAAKILQKTYVGVHAGLCKPAVLVELVM